MPYVQQGVRRCGHATATRVYCGKGLVEVEYFSLTALRAELAAIEADLCVDEREIEDPALVKIACAYNDGVKAALAAMRRGQ